MKRNFLICIFFVGLLSSYRTNKSLFLTFKNDTSEDFKQLKVFTSSGFYFFFNLEKGKKSNPIEIENLNKFTYAEVITANDTLITSANWRSGEKIFTEGEMIMSFQIVPKDIHKKRSIVIKTEIQPGIDSTSKKN